MLQRHGIGPILSYIETHAEPEEVGGGGPEKFLFYLWWHWRNVIGIRVSVLTLQFLPAVPTRGGR